MKQLYILNLYHISILQLILFMFKVKNNTVLRAFLQVFSLKDHIYPRKILDQIFNISDFSLKLTRFGISFTGGKYGINFLQTVKSLILSLMYLKKSKEKNLNIPDKILLF